LALLAAGPKQDKKRGGPDAATGAGGGDYAGVVPEGVFLRKGRETVGQTPRSLVGSFSNRKTLGCGGRGEKRREREGLRERERGASEATENEKEYENDGVRRSRVVISLHRPGLLP